MELFDKLVGVCCFLGAFGLSGNVAGFPVLNLLAESVLELFDLVLIISEFLPKLCLGGSYFLVNSNNFADFEGVFANLTLEPRPSAFNSACGGVSTVVVNYVLLIVLI